MKILLVDDEYYILHGLRQLVEHSFPQLEILCSDNRAMAMELLNSERPDILISDIRIAQENGLDLIQSIKEELPELHIYVISGYSEFEYAKRAVELKVRNYILKPINQENLIQLIGTSISEIRQRREKSENEKYHLRAARKNFLLNCVHLGSVDARMEEVEKRLGLEALFEHYVVVNMRLKDYWTIATYQQSIQLSNLRLFVEQIVDEEAVSCLKGQYLMAETENGNYILVMYAAGGVLDKVLKRIRQQIVDEFRITSDLQISSPSHGLGEFYRAYCESRGFTFHYRRHMLPTYGREAIEKDIEEMREKMLHALEEENYLQLSGLIDVLIKKFTLEYNNNPAGIVFISNIYNEIYNYMRNECETLEFAWDFDIREPSLPNEAGSIHHYTQSFEQLSKALLQLQKLVNTNRNITIITKVKQYLDENISEATLENAAVYAKMNPIYLSIIFKEVTGENFRDYLIRSKIQMAKDLLIQTNHKIYEISTMVGYTDIKYFSKNFKKYVGCTPNEYRLRAD